MRPCPLYYNGAIVKKLVIFLKSVQLFRLQLAHSKEEERFCGMGSLLNLGGSCGVREMGCGVWGTDCGSLTADLHTKVTAVHFRMYCKLTGGRLKLFHSGRDATKKKNVLAAWEALVNWGGNCGVREQDTHKGNLCPLCKVTVLLLRIVHFMNRLMPSNKWHVRQWFFLATAPTVTFMPRSSTRA